MTIQTATTKHATTTTSMRNFRGMTMALEEMVGTARFELATSRAPSVRARRLRYVPSGNLTTTRQIREGRIPVASALTRLSPAFEKRQESVQRIAQVQQHLAAEQLSRTVRGVIRAADRRFVRAAFFAQVAARAGNREAFIVKQPLDAEDHVHVFLAIDAAARVILRRLQHGNFGFPVAQHECFQVGEAADLANGIQASFGSGFCGGDVACHAPALPERGRRYRSSLRAFPVEVCSDL